jgi:kynureninase
MHLLPEFKPVPGAEGWQLSNPPILAAAPLRASIEIFDRVGMAALRAKSVLLTAYLEFLLRELCDDDIALVTPAEPERRGCQLSLLLKKEARARHDALRRSGVTCDFREPDIIRVAPVPLYNSFRDVHHLATALAGGKS